MSTFSIQICVLHKKKLISNRLIKHTEKLLEEKEEKLCVKVLRTLREMMAIDSDYGEKVSMNIQF